VAAVDVDVYGDAPVKEIGAVSGPGSGWRVSPLAAGVVIAALIGLGLIVINQTGLSSPERSADPPVTTQPPSTAPVEPPTSDTATGVATSDPATGDPLVWQEGPVIGDVASLAVLEYGGSVLLFTTQPLQPFATSGEGMEMWRSVDGVSWDSLGAVIEAPNEIKTVIAAPDRLLAVGKDPDGLPTLWVSVDGSEWTPQQLPTDQTAPLTAPTQVVVSGDLIVVTGAIDPVDPWPAAYQAMFDLTGFDPATTSFQATGAGSSLTFTLQGPFGLTVYSASPEELGLSADQVATLTSNEGRRPVATIWASTNNADWHTESLENAHPRDISVAADGRVVVSIADDEGEHLLFSADGIVWEKPPRPSGERSFPVRWGSRLIEIADDRDHLLVSENGVAGVQTQLSDLLPDTSKWFGNSVIAGDEGIAVVATSWSDQGGTESDPIPAILVKDGYTLTVGESDFSGLELRRGDTKLARIPIFSTLGYVADVTAETITVLDHDTGDPYVTFTFDELRQLESATNMVPAPPTQESMVLFSTDAHTWSINDITDFAGTNTGVDKLQITTQGLITAIAHDPSGQQTTSNPSSVQIFTAELPN